ncbi:hypothetical protein [uncultured Tateyamaria sp.]|uniref:hypothetical protein n=1 Tax=uncultured Tateyamaria sp. TaxID=455651 RepID=UPI00345CDF30
MIVIKHQPVADGDAFGGRYDLIKAVPDNMQRISMDFDDPNRGALRQFVNICLLGEKVSPAKQGEGGLRPFFGFQVGRWGKKL